MECLSNGVFCENSIWLRAINHFCKMLLLRSLAGLRIDSSDAFSLTVSTISSDKVIEISNFTVSVDKISKLCLFVALK